MIGGGGGGDWFYYLLLALAAGCLWPSQLLSIIGIEHWRQTIRMVRLAQVIAFILYFLFAALFYFTLDEPYLLLMFPIVMLIFFKVMIHFAISLLGYDDDSHY